MKRPTNIAIVAVSLLLLSGCAPTNTGVFDRRQVATDMLPNSLAGVQGLDTATARLAGTQGDTSFYLVKQKPSADPNVVCIGVYNSTAPESWAMACGSSSMVQVEVPNFGSARYTSAAVGKDAVPTGWKIISENVLVRN